MTQGKSRIITEESKMVAKFTATALGGKPTVKFYDHDYIDLSVAVMTVIDCPSPGVSAYASVQLSDYPLWKSGKEFPTRIELVSASDSKNEKFPNIVASVAAHIIRNKIFVCPGSVLPGYISVYYKDTTVPNAYFTNPSFWEDSLITTNFNATTVSWLMLVPISDAEMEFIKKNGDSDFEDLLEKSDVDVFDIFRNSIV
jgi:hypothetical protein